MLEIDYKDIIKSQPLNNVVMIGNVSEGKTTLVWAITNKKTI